MNWGHFFSLLSWTVAALFGLMTLATLAHLRWVRRLPALDSARDKQHGSTNPIRVSIVLAARDEEARIRNTLERLLRQQGIELELIVVNDRSRDGTQAILEQLAAEDRRLVTLRVDSLPQGWLGKCYACHLAANRATGAWILFTDADCWLTEDTVLRAVHAAEREQANHVVLAPGMEPEGFITRSMQASFVLAYSNHVARVNREHPYTYIGAGAFNLVRSDLYRRCGGYEALRLTVVDDVKLGQLIRRAGGRTRAFLGSRDAMCHWGTTVRGLLHNLEKNHFALADYRVGRVIAAIVGTILLWGCAGVGPWMGTPSGWAAFLSCQSLSIPAALLARRVGWTAWSGLLAPWLLPILTYSLVNSTWKTLRQGGVRWRDTFYPLALLRKHNVR
ncbi:MAG: glycosyltransferase family 2 protein [Verrucomicrobiales bacterium]|nr:glycosyltransferase family 2 protein [Verrucomicrobiales bacterium]